MGLGLGEVDAQACRLVLLGGWVSKYGVPRYLLLPIVSVPMPVPVVGEPSSQCCSDSDEIAPEPPAIRCKIQVTRCYLRVSLWKKQPIENSSFGCSRILEDP